jgi:hypothetical protein
MNSTDVEHALKIAPVTLKLRCEGPRGGRARELHRQRARRMRELSYDADLRTGRRSFQGRSREAQHEELSGRRKMLTAQSQEAHPMQSIAFQFAITSRGDGEYQEGPQGHTS